MPEPPPAAPATATTAPAAPVPAGPITRLDDFPDRLSPMLVKELRQGMRTNLFSVAFLLLQAFMVLCVLMGASSPAASSGVSGFFWFFIIVTLLVVMPVRGFSALTTEMSLNTMDLIQLTKLSAWRITFGKWAALVSQSLLLVCGVLPYLVMRYFFGGVDLIVDLWLIFGCLLGSMVLTAITVAYSAFRSVILRALVVFGIVMMTLNIGVLGIMIGPMGGIPGGMTIYGSSEFWLAILIAVAGSAWLIFFLLDFGASRIAPDAENFSTRKRIGGLVFAVLIMLLPYAGVELEIALALAATVASTVCIDAITERPSILPSVLLPFSKPHLRPLQMFLTPGWHTGIRFFLLFFFVIVGLTALHEGADILTDTQWVQMFLSAAGMIGFPLIIIHLFFSKMTDLPSCYGLYILVQTCVSAVSGFLMGLSDAIGLTAYGLVPIPFVTWIAAMDSDEDPTLVVCAATFLALSFIVPAWRARSLDKATRSIMRQLRSGKKTADS